ncbi:5-oxoprolinase subunit PxpA [Ferrimonas pelagia]|uniref:5-oxoprolinase subunit PxpA n=1 Tax=Ferrimonas pelagia TaxID=1177826 RepID=A0ABP9EYV0_9GAMM
MKTLDLNCDLGEGCGQDQALMPMITSANIACGAHAGNEETMSATVALALEHQIAIGAHPGFADPSHFGRREIWLSRQELFTLISRQIEQLATITERQGGRLHHVKLHGALYNQSARDPNCAAALVDAVKGFDPTLKVYVLAKSPLVDLAQAADLTVIQEVFADRRYRPDGALVPRQSADALITDPLKCLQQLEQMVCYQRVQACDGSWVSVKAQTLCLHGDGLHAVSFAQAICQWMQRHHIDKRAP